MDPEKYAKEIKESADSLELKLVAKMYNVTGIPATFLIDGEGIVRKVELRSS